MGDKEEKYSEETIMVWATVIGELESGLRKKIGDSKTEVGGDIYMLEGKEHTSFLIW